MKPKVLLKITKSLKDVLEELNKLGIVDSRLRSKYAEYLVAYELAKRGVMSSFSMKERTQMRIFT